MIKRDEFGDPMSPFLWAQCEQPSIFAKDLRFTGRYKVPTSPLSITISNKFIINNAPLPAYSKAKHGNR
jgi:hypothetical protein